MPSAPRLDLPGIPQHVVQRGVDRRPCFVLEAHYREYLSCLREEAVRCGCEVRAYVLMCNHTHILATPQEAGGIGRLMQSLGRRYVGFFNYSMGRTGTLWEGRFKSCLVDSEAYVLLCYRYIELNPVRAGIVGQPEAFRWSSFQCNGWGKSDPIVVPHPACLGLGASIEERLEAYRAIVRVGCAQREAEEIRAMTSRHRAFGSDEFKQRLEAAHARPMGLLKRGRPSVPVAE